MCFLVYLRLMKGKALQEGPLALIVHINMLLIRKELLPVSKGAFFSMFLRSRTQKAGLLVCPPECPARLCIARAAWTMLSLTSKPSVAITVHSVCQHDVCNRV